MADTNTNERTIGSGFYNGMEWFGAWLVDHCEYETITEELIHKWAVEAWHDHLKQPPATDDKPHEFQNENCVICGVHEVHAYVPCKRKRGDATCAQKTLTIIKSKSLLQYMQSESENLRKIKSASNAASNVQSADAAQAAPLGEQEWTHKTVQEFVNCQENWRSVIAEAHNAALAAATQLERNRWQQVSHDFTNALGQLAAERKEIAIRDRAIERREIANKDLGRMLAAERQRREEAEKQDWRHMEKAHKEVKLMEQQLAAERQRREQAEATANHNADIGDSIARASKQTEDALRQQLLSAQAAIESHNNAPLPDCPWGKIEVDLSALHQHDAELMQSKGQLGQADIDAIRKPLATANLRLVEALEAIPSMLDQMPVRTGAHRIKDHISDALVPLGGMKEPPPQHVLD